MKKTPQQLFDAASQAGSHLRRGVSSSIHSEISPLIGWAAFHLGSTHAAEAMVTSLGTVDGRRDLQRLLRSDSVSSLEIHCFVLACTSVVTAVDLCASAIYRIAGGTPPTDREFDLRRWGGRAGHRNSKLPIPPPAVDRWLVAMQQSSDQDFIETARHQAIHRKTQRTVYLTTRTDRVEPFSEFEVDGQSYPLDVLVNMFAEHGERSFDSFCTAIAADFP